MSEQRSVQGDIRYVQTAEEARLERYEGREKALIVGFLQRVIIDFDIAHVRQEAIDYVNDTERGVDDPFSLAWCCSMLDLDLGVVRKGLLDIAMGRVSLPRVGRPPRKPGELAIRGGYNGI